MGDGAPLLTNGLDSPDHRGVLSAPLWGDDWFRPPAKRAWRGLSIATPSSVPPTAPTRLLPSCGRSSAKSLFHRFMQVADNKTMEPVARHSAATRLRVAERTEVSTDSNPVQQLPGGVRGHEKSPLVARLRGWRPKRTRPGAWNDWLAAIDFPPVPRGPVRPTTDGALGRSEMHSRFLGIRWPGAVWPSRPPAVGVRLSGVVVGR